MSVYSEEPGQAILWNASLVLLKYLEKHVQNFVGKQVLELGAGRGNLSVGLAKMGAHVTSTEASCQRQGELNCGCWGCTMQLRKGIASSLPGMGAAGSCQTECDRMSVEGGGSVRVAELGWGEAAYNKSGALKCGEDGGVYYDIVVMSECIYNQSADSLYDDEFHDKLVWTLLKFTSRPGCVVYNVFVDRPFSFMFFAKINDVEGNLFEVTQVGDDEFDNMGIDDEDAKLYIHHIVRKRSHPVCE